MNLLGKLLRILAALAVAGVAAGCATIPPGAGSNPADPWEVYNRNMFEINQNVDRAVVKPIAKAYEAILPAEVRTCINNAFLNLGEAVNFVNNVLQGKPEAAITDLCRFVINTTVGVAGCFDVAAKMGMPRSNEDFGQTLARWGFPSGPYFVLPFLGPSTVRDTVGRISESLSLNPLIFVNDVALRNSLIGLGVVDLRASLLPAEKVLDAAAIDRYEFVRDAFLQLRRNLIHDGNPPRLIDPDDDDNGAELPKPAAGTEGGAPGQPKDGSTP